jgi:hypothetical protein
MQSEQAGASGTIAGSILPSSTCDFVCRPACQSLQRGNFMDAIMSDLLRVGFCLRAFLDADVGLVKGKAGKQQGLSWPSCE